MFDVAATRDKGARTTRVIFPGESGHGKDEAVVADLRSFGSSSGAAGVGPKRGCLKHLVRLDDGDLYIGRGIILGVEACWPGPSGPTLSDCGTVRARASASRDLRRTSPAPGASCDSCLRWLVSAWLATASRISSVMQTF